MRSLLAIPALLAAAGACALRGDPALRETLASHSVGTIRVGAVRNAGPEVRIPPVGLLQSVFTGGAAPPDEVRALSAVTRAADRALRARGLTEGGGSDAREANLEIDVTLFDASHLPDRRTLRIGARLRIVDPTDGTVLDAREVSPRDVTGIQTARADDFEPYVEAFLRRALGYLPSR